MCVGVCGVYGVYRCVCVCVGECACVYDSPAGAVTGTNSTNAATVAWIQGPTSGVLTRQLLSHCCGVVWCVVCSVGCIVCGV